MCIFLFIQNNFFMICCRACTIFYKKLPISLDFMQNKLILQGQLLSYEHTFEIWKKILVKQHLQGGFCETIETLDLKCIFGIEREIKNPVRIQKWIPYCMNSCFLQWKHITYENYQSTHWEENDKSCENGQIRKWVFYCGQPRLKWEAGMKGEDQPQIFGNISHKNI